ncbi:MAG TPA: polysaccharide deacetylase [Gaiellaceae bacterium]|nr:polysaccharide deacetylase [Gaiellaceae bacterium]
MTWLGSSAALAILSFDVDAESAILPSGRRYAEHPSAMSHQRYGPLVGVPRILAMLDDLAVAATFFVPGWTADRYPQAVELVLEHGHEVAHHGHSHISPVRMTEAEERRDIELGLAALEQVGVRPEGYRTPSWEPSMRTFELLAEYGLAYDSSLMDDDKPYVLETAAGPLVELPAHWGLDDWSQYMHLPDPRSGSGTVHPPSRAIAVWREELEGMRRHGCLWMLTMHPFLSGRPGRVEALRGLVEHALGCGDVELVSCGEAARRARADEALPRRPLPALELGTLYPE